MKIVSLKFVSVAILGALIGGCSTYTEQVVSQSFQPAEAPVILAKSTNMNGAIFQPGRSGLFATDQRARRIGDILTVSFNETYAATKAQTMLTGGFDKDPAGLNAGTTRSFAGAGNAVQSNSFSGLLSVTVIRVFDNGNMEVQGQKELTLNNGNEYVRLRGVVRPEDISANNIVSSDRLADAQIRYTGSGHLADSSQPGWLSQLMRTISPF